jgi:hypothetical protein
MLKKRANRLTETYGVTINRNRDGFYVRWTLRGQVHKSKTILYYLQGEDGAFYDARSLAWRKIEYLRKIAVTDPKYTVPIYKGADTSYHFDQVSKPHFPMPPRNPLYPPPAEFIPLRADEEDFLQAIAKVETQNAQHPPRRPSHKRKHRE